MDNKTSVEEEAAPYRDLTPSMRAGLLAAACRAAMRLLWARQDRERVLRYVDALPESSVRALARLRRQARDGRR